MRKPYSECDESPVVTTCSGCGEIYAEDDCPYCETEIERLREENRILQGGLEAIAAGWVEFDGGPRERMHGTVMQSIAINTLAHVKAVEGATKKKVPVAWIAPSKLEVLLGNKRSRSRWVQVYPKQYLPDYVPLVLGDVK